MKSKEQSSFISRHAAASLTSPAWRGETGVEPLDRRLSNEEREEEEQGREREGGQEEEEDKLSKREPSLGE